MSFLDVSSGLTGEYRVVLLGMMSCRLIVSSEESVLVFSDFCLMSSKHDVR